MAAGSVTSSTRVWTPASVARAAALMSVASTSAPSAAKRLGRGAADSLAGGGDQTELALQAVGHGGLATRLCQAGQALHLRRRVQRFVGRGYRIEGDDGSIALPPSSLADRRYSAHMPVVSRS